MSNETLIVVADDDPDFHEIIPACLEDLSPSPRFLFAQSTESLIQTIHMREVDLITLDISFSQDNQWTREGLDALPALIKCRPRIPIVMVSGNIFVNDNIQELLGKSQVVAFVEKGCEGFMDKLAAAAERALAWGREQRQQADAIFEHADAAAALGNSIDAARLYIDAFKTGDLSGEKKRQFKERLSRLLPSLTEVSDLQSEAFRSLLIYCFESNDELGVIFYANAWRERFPEFEREAREYLIMAAELGDKIYAMVNERLELVSSYRNDGSFSLIIQECQAIQRVLANVVPSYVQEAEALEALGRYEEAIEVHFGLIDMTVRNGELDLATDCFKRLTQLDLHGVHQDRLEAKKQRIKEIAEQLTQLENPLHYPRLQVCTNPDCQQEAAMSGGFFRVSPTLRPEECDFCGAAYLKAPEELKGKVISIIGGRFKDKYQRAILALGAKDVLHHDAIHELGRIPGVISPADGVIIVTGYASHAGTIKAEHELSRTGKPRSRVHFYGVRQVIRCLIKDLLPEMGKDRAAV